MNFPYAHISGVTGRVIYTSDHFEVMIISSELRNEPQISLDDEETRRSAFVMHADSLDRETYLPRLAPWESVRSKMDRGFACVGHAVDRLPCVLQLCGIAACLNEILFTKCGSLQAISSGKLDDILTEFDLPDLFQWTVKDWIRTGLVFCCVSSDY
jgi:hypothetical protein